MKETQKYDSIRPGQVWLDTEGKRIHAHGGSIMEWNGTYYWYGENKEFTTGVPAEDGASVWHWGVRCYSSKDFYNWTDLGLIIPPNETDKTSPLYPCQCMDRPHIIYNQKTKKFVCYLKIMLKDGSYRQGMTILTADALTGPYTIVRTNYFPNDMSSGDFDLVTDQETGKGYFYYEKPHSELICAELTDDYTGVNGKYSVHFPQPGPPFVREAPAHFLYQGRHYLVTSGTTGYHPNPSEIAVADSWHGPFSMLGNPHPEDASNTSFHSQISSVFHVPDSKLYIALADRWLPQYQYIPYEETKNAFARWFIKEYVETHPEPQEASEARGKLFQNVREETRLADYVWLPFVFDGEYPVLKWHDNWRIEDYL